MRTGIQRSATFLLATFMVGALLLPFAHELTHVRSLEHRHGRAASDFSGDAEGAFDFLVEERTVPHNPNCDLCARLVLDVPLENDPVVPLRQVEDKRPPTGMSHGDGRPASRQIRAPPRLS